MKIALTQSRGRLEGLDHALVELGFDVIRTPLIEVRPRLGGAVRRRGLDLARLPWLLFASRSAVRAWRLLRLPFRGPRFGAVGPATAATLAREGSRVELIGQPATAAGLADSFLRHLEVAPCPSEPVGLPRGHLGDPTLQRRLEAAGLDVVTLVLYETVSLPWSADAEIDAIVLASPSAVRALPERVAAGATLVTLGPSTSGAVRALGLQPNEVAEPSTDAILERLTHLRRR